MNRIEQIKGCLLGGAVVNALGAPVEFLEWSAIRATFSAQARWDGRGPDGRSRRPSQMRC